MCHVILYPATYKFILKMFPFVFVIIQNSWNSQNYFVISEKLPKPQYKMSFNKERKKKKGRKDLFLPLQWGQVNQWLTLGPVDWFQFLSWQVLSLGSGKAP